MTEEIRTELGKIYERLAKLEAQNAVISEKIDSYAEGHLEIIKRHDVLLYGNGVQGLKDKVILLEHIEEKRTKHIFALWTALLTFSSSILFKMIFK